MEEAERISRDEHGSSKLAVISGEIHQAPPAADAVALFKTPPLQLTKGNIYISNLSPPSIRRLCGMESVTTSYFLVNYCRRASAFGLLSP